jgi:hypothetical protein
MLSHLIKPVEVESLRGNNLPLQGIIITQYVFDIFQSNHFTPSRQSASSLPARVTKPGKIRPPP